MLLTTNFEMTDRRRKRRPKVVPRAAADFVRQLKKELDKLIQTETVFNMEFKFSQNRHGVQKA